MQNLTENMEKNGKTDVAGVGVGNDCAGSVILYYCLCSPAVSALCWPRVVFIW